MGGHYCISAKSAIVIFPGMLWPSMINRRVCRVLKKHRTRRRGEDGDLHLNSSFAFLTASILLMWTQKMTAHGMVRQKAPKIGTPWRQNTSFNARQSGQAKYYRPAIVTLLSGRFDQHHAEPCLPSLGILP